MLTEPFQGLLGHLLERPWFFKQMRRTRNDHQLLWASEKRIGMLIQLDHGVIFAADQEQGWGDHLRQETFGEVRPPSARHNGSHLKRSLCSGLESGGSSGAGTEVAQWQFLGTRVFSKPGARHHHTIG